MIFALSGSGEMPAGPIIKQRYFVACLKNEHFLFKFQLVSCAPVLCGQYNLPH